MVTQTLSPSTKPAADIQEPTTTSLEPNPSAEPPSPATQPRTNDTDLALKRKRETDDADDPDTQTGSSDPKPLHPLHKTSLCSFFRRHDGGLCSHGESCRFAHTEEELRARPDGSWDPTSERAKKLMRRECEEEEEEKESVVMMTEAIDECGGGGDLQLSKCLIHLPLKWTSELLKTFLDDQGVTVKSAKKKKGMSVGFVTFETAEQLKSTIEVLDGKTIGNKKLKVGDVVPRSYDDNIKSAAKKYQTLESGAVDQSEASASSNDHENADGANGSGSNAKSVRDAVTPLAHMPYTEQLEQKKNTLLQMLKKLTRNARKACPKGIVLPEWVSKSREIGGLPCNLEGIIESPLINGYRNKCEFSVGYSVQGKPTVGFMLGNFRAGVTAVEEPVDCLNVSKIACKYSLIFQEFLQDSALPIWNRFNNSGFWRQLTVREGRRPQENTEAQSHEATISEVLLMVQVCTSGCDNDVINSELEKMTQAFVTGAASTSPPLPLTALVLQDHKGISNAAPADAPLRPLPITITQSNSGSEVVKTVHERIHDYIGNLQFSISPTAFFQVNTLAAEKLYSLAGDWARLGPDTLLFDVCCGTGTIGLTLANRVGMVVGIEMNASAVIDAQRNAEINGIANCKFICSKAEDVIGSLLKEYFDVPLEEDSKSPDNDGKHNEAADNVTLSVDNNESDPEKGLKAENMEADHPHCSNGSTKDKQNNDHNTTVDCGSAEQRFKNVVANCKFICSKADDVIGSLLKDVPLEEDSKSSDNDGKHNEAANNVTPSVDNNESDPEKGLKAENMEADHPHCSNGSTKDKQNNDHNTTVDSGSAKEQRFKNVVAIVDPPRSGLHPVVLKALRTHPGLKRLVYISCNPETLVANAIELCTPSAEKTDKGNNRGQWRNMSNAGLARHRLKSMPISEPFKPVKAMAVDLFPHTPHCELVMLLER